MLPVVSIASSRSNLRTGAAPDRTVTLCRCDPAASAMATGRAGRPGPRGGRVAAGGGAGSAVDPRPLRSGRVGEGDGARRNARYAEADAAAEPVQPRVEDRG